MTNDGITNRYSNYLDSIIHYKIAMTLNTEYDDNDVDDDDDDDSDNYDVSNDEDFR